MEQSFAQLKEEGCGIYVLNCISSGSSSAGQRKYFILASKKLPFPNKCDAALSQYLSYFHVFCSESFVSDDPNNVFLSQQIGRCGPTIDVMPVEDVKWSSAKWSHAEDCTEIIVHAPHMPYEEKGVH